MEIISPLLHGDFFDSISYHDYIKDEIKGKGDNMNNDWLSQEPIAHRGFHWQDGIDENSYEAFKLAIEKNRPIECDLHLSRDGEVFIHHDASLERMSAKALKIAELSSSELRKVRTFHSDRPIMSLKELLAMVHDQVPLVLEVKRTLPNNLLEKRVLELISTYKGRYSLQSFHPLSLLFLRNQAPKAVLGMLIGEESLGHLIWGQRVLLKSLALSHVIKPQYIAQEWSGLHKRAPQELRERLEIPLLAWTVKDERSLRISRKYADGIIYENIDNLL
ncbi:MAG: hypothetical protein CME60_04335 [Halobacteriovoraceae bacterium]|nr:hypothetical protein [Halobacteriovoraceae bacterium]